MSVSAHDIARILTEALPHMQRYDDETVVVKYGGHAMGAEASARSFARDIVLMEQTAINPVVVHGGGPQIGDMLGRLGIKSEFAGGLRITDEKTKWCWPARSTSNWSASSTPPAARRSGSPARTATW
jgi:acetylglutamate kinase